MHGLVVTMHAWLHSLIGDLVRVGAGGHPGVRDAALCQDQVPLVGGEGGRTRVMALWGVCVRSLQLYKAIRQPIAVQANPGVRVSELPVARRSLDSPPEATTRTRSPYLPRMSQ